MIAEEVGEVLPEIVVYEDNGVDASGLDYSKLTPILVEAVKELKAEVDQLRSKQKAKDSIIELLGQQNTALQQRLVTIESRLKILVGHTDAKSDL